MISYELHFSSLDRGSAPTGTKKAIIDRLWQQELKLPFEFRSSRSGIAEAERIFVKVLDSASVDSGALVPGIQYKAWIATKIHTEKDKIPYPVDFTLTHLQSKD